MKVRKVLMVCAADISAAKLLVPQVRALEEAGYAVHIACAGGEYAEALREEGFTLRTLDILNRISPLANLKTIHSLRSLMLREGYDVVHAHMISAGFLGRVAARLARIPFIFYTFRGFAFYEGSSKRLKVFNLLIERTCSRWTTWFFSQSEENRQRAVQHGVIPSDRCTTIGNGICLAEFNLESGEARRLAAEVREELGIRGDAFVIGFVGRLVTEKGIFELLEAATKVLRIKPNTVCLIVGDALPSDHSVKPEIAETIRASGYTPQFILTGWRSDISRLYHAMDVFVLPSYREGMPRSIMEAMAAGKPVIATDIAGCRDEVLDGVTGVLVPPMDADAISRALVRLIEDPALGRGMGREGQSRAQALFDEQGVCARLLEKYDVLLGAEEADSRRHIAHRVQLGLKRVLDYAVAIPTLILLGPLFVIIAIAIKVDSPGPVFFTQVREGWKRRPFRIVKFRTMKKNSEMDGLEIKKDDARITRVGRLLRKTSVDELPQLLNILRGEMSLVGPRPLLPGTTRAEEERRLDFRPGITSYPALFGRHALSWEDRMPLDLWYADNWSLRLDLFIILRTIPVVLSMENIYDARGGSHKRSAPDLSESAVHGMDPK